MEGLASIPGTEQGHSSMGLQTVRLHVTCTGGVGSTPMERNHRDSGAYAGGGKSLIDTVSAIIRSVFLCFRKTTLVIV